MILMVGLAPLGSGRGALGKGLGRGAFGNGRHLSLDVEEEEDDKREALDIDFDKDGIVGFVLIRVVARSLFSFQDPTPKTSLIGGV